MKYEVDDRGNIAQFYDIEADQIVARLDREAGPNGDQTTWDGDEEVTKWANANGYNLTCVGKKKT